MTVTMVVVSSQVVMTIARVQDFHLYEVEAETENSYNEHNVPNDWLWVDYSESSFIHKPNSQSPYEDDTDESTNNLRSVVAERQ